MAVIAGAKAPSKTQHGRTLFLFGLGSVITMIGLVLWRQNEKGDDVSEARTTDLGLSKLMTLIEC